MMNSYGKRKKSFYSPQQHIIGNNNFTPRSSCNDGYSPRPYFCDQQILNRVSLYLKDAGTGSNIDFDHMVDELQRVHREYRRRKRAAFKQLLRKAVEVILFDDAMAQNGSDVNVDDDDKDVNVVVSDRSPPAYGFEGVRDVNSVLEDSYFQQNAKRSRKTSTSGSQELISILTSDEENAEDAPAKVAEGKSSESPPRRAEPPAPETTTTPLTKPETRTVKKRRVEATLPGSNSFKSSLEPVRPSVTFKDIGGNEKVLKQITPLLMHMQHPEVYRLLRVSPPRGFLLYGPPGSGKTLLAHAISGELKIPLLKVAAPELVGGLSGQSEERIRELFDQAAALAPCILFIDEVDAITPNRETAQREMERRIVAQLLSSMDELANKEKGDQVLVIGATNRPDSLDPALRRAGRFDREVCLGIPDRESRLSILQTLCHTLRLAPDLQLAEVAMMTPGYVGADLKSLVTESAMAAVIRVFEALKKDIKVLPAESTDTQDSEGTTTEVPPAEVAESTVVQDSGGMITSTEQTTVENNDNYCQITSVIKLTIKPQTGGTQDDEVILLDPDEETSPSRLSQPDLHIANVESLDKPLQDEREGGDSGCTEPPPAESTFSALLHSAPLTEEQLNEVYITMEDFQTALKLVQPSAKREGFATVPGVKWEDIGSLQDIRNDLKMAMLAPVKFPQLFTSMGLATPTGVLLCGPPGCGKTLLAKALANEAGINFISVKGPELLNMYVGESERAVRQCFQRARSSQPCVIFFDEIDALCSKRTHMENGASRVVNQLLTEMDGLEARPGVFLMAATNRPDIVDPAVMRPGRLDKVLYVGLPGAEDRVDILRAVTKGGKIPLLAEDVELAEVARDPRCDGYTGADLAALVREASTEALKEFMESKAPDPAVQVHVCKRHFTAALDKIRPSVSDRDKKRYEELRLQYAAVPSNRCKEN